MADTGGRERVRVIYQTKINFRTPEKSLQVDGRSIEPIRAAARPQFHDVRR